MATKSVAPARPAKSLYRAEFQIIVDEIRALRHGTGLTQTEFAARLGRSQAYVSAAERGARLDALQIRDWCRACGTTLVAWAGEVEKQLSEAESPRMRIRPVAKKTKG